MQYWPRKRASRQYARVRSWNKTDKPQLLGFAGYKAGMTHIMVEDTRKNSTTKGDKISVPVSIVEVPPMKIISIRLYKKVDNELRVATEIMAKGDKFLARKLSVPKKDGSSEHSLEDVVDVRVNVATQPHLTGLGKKKPEVFEIALGGSVDEAFNYAKENLGKEIGIKDVFTPGHMVDIHAVNTGKGYQGPVKRFGISIRSHKSEKTIRGPGSIAGGWKAQGHMMYRVPMAGQMGYHLRTEFNKQILAIMDNPDEINPKGGFVGFGNVKNQYVLIKGSVGAPKKRLVTMTVPVRKPAKAHEEAPKILYISQESKQGR